MREQKYSYWRKQLTDIQGERKRKNEMKSFHSGYSDQEVRIKVYHSKVPSSELKTLERWMSRSMLDPLFLLIFRLI